MTLGSEVPGPQGTRFSTIRHLSETGSTNADLLAAAGEGQAEGAVLVTDHQTAGRGRQSRAWHDEPGNSMLMSALLRPPMTIAPLIPLVAGLAIADAVGSLISELRSDPDPVSAALKWPNDVLVPEWNERKLAGILSEATTVVGAPTDTRLAVVVGMGLNIRFATEGPEEVAARAVSLEQVLGGGVDRWLVVTRVLEQLDRWLTTAYSDGPSAVLGPYRERCLTIGRKVRLQRPIDVIEGNVSAVDDSGALVVETANGPVAVTAGDAHHI